MTSEQPAGHPRAGERPLPDSRPAPGSDATVRRGRAIVGGEVRGPALVVERGLSFAMGFDVETGRITDVHSPHTGTSLLGRVLVMPTGRGSSSASTSLAEAIRRGTAPLAIVLDEVDEILVAGAIVARMLYGRTCPILVADAADHAVIETGTMITIAMDGTFSLAG